MHPSEYSYFIQLQPLNQPRSFSRSTRPKERSCALGHEPLPPTLASQSSFPSGTSDGACTVDPEIQFLTFQLVDLQLKFPSSTFTKSPDDCRDTDPMQFITTIPYPWLLIRYRAWIRTKLDLRLAAHQMPEHWIEQPVCYRGHNYCKKIWRFDWLHTKSNWNRLENSLRVSTTVLFKVHVLPLHTTRSHEDSAGYLPQDFILNPSKWNDFAMVHEYRTQYQVAHPTGTNEDSTVTSYIQVNWMEDPLSYDLKSSGPNPDKMDLSTVYLDLV